MSKPKKNILIKINGALTTQVMHCAVKMNLFESEYTLNLASTKILRPLNALKLIEWNGDKWCITEEGSYLSSTHPDSMRDLLLYKAAPFNWNAYGSLFDTLQNGSSFDLFEYLQNNPDEMEIFQNAMSYFERSSSTALLDTLDFSEYSTVCDLGCGTGGFLKRILERFPHLKGLGIDLPSAIELANPALPLEGGDFFQKVPQGYDLYILRNILHDWDDDACIKLLNNIPKNCHVFIFETIVPEDPDRRLAAFSDLHLTATTNGGEERTLAEYEKLFSKTHFKLESVIESTSAKSALMLT